MTTFTESAVEQTALARPKARAGRLMAFDQPTCELSISRTITLQSAEP
jgi:hypothetical protein